MGKIEEKLKEYTEYNKGSIAWRLHKHCEVIEKHLNEGEEVKFVFAGQKNDEFYDIFTTCVVALTNRRIIVAQKRLFWGYFLKIITPDLFNDLSVYQGLIWGKIKIDTIKEVVTISNISKNGIDDIETNITEQMIKCKKEYAKKIS